MTKLCTYECNICGKVFNNEKDCRKHELEHDVAMLKNAVATFDLSREPLSLDDIGAAIDKAYAVYYHLLDLKETVEKTLLD